jgi:hypothetical protein
MDRGGVRPPMDRGSDRWGVGEPAEIVPQWIAAATAGGAAAAAATAEIVPQWIVEVTAGAAAATVEIAPQWTGRLWR